MARRKQITHTVRIGQIVMVDSQTALRTSAVTHMSDGVRLWAHDPATVGHAGRHTAACWLLVLSEETPEA